MKREISDQRVPPDISSESGSSGADNASSENSALEQLERQVERSSFFTHTAIGRNFARLSEVESFVYGLIDVLIAKGIVSSAEITIAVEKIQVELANRKDVPVSGVALRVDAIEEIPSAGVQVDCAARMHVCHAVCCKLDFALSSEEVESGKVKWDLGRPYFIRHEIDGYCSHSDRKTGCCGIYADRPAVCRGYSCANDQRIWRDFAKMELNEEWLKEYLSATNQPRLVAALMQNNTHPT